MKTKHNKEEQCVVCGAAVRNKGWRRWAGYQTCDHTCRRARAAGRTRPAQIRAEIQAEARADRARSLSDRLMERTIHAAVEDFDYNRPYMAEATA